MCSYIGSSAKEGSSGEWQPLRKGMFEVAIHLTVQGPNHLQAILSGPVEGKEKTKACGIPLFQRR